MSKRIVICCDGTWNKPDQRDGDMVCPSNVVKTAHAVLPRAPDGTHQIVFYDQGAGTDRGINRWVGGGFGVGLSKNVEDAYRFLLHNHEGGDELFLFGFSRGAYTARSTAGLIRNCGLLTKTHADRFPEVYDIYRRSDAAPDSELAREFRAAYSREPEITFVGVWDTVGALGIPIGVLDKFAHQKHQFHDVRLSSHVKYAYQALAVDERRKPLKPAIWETKEEADQTVEQVWFAGVHANIGGGYRDAGLSDLAFTWLKNKAQGAGLAFGNTYFAEITDPNYAGELRQSMTLGYRLLGQHPRPIGALSTSESIHESAFQRYDNRDLSYRPGNLAALADQRPTASD